MSRGSRKRASPCPLTACRLTPHAALHVPLLPPAELDPPGLHEPIVFSQGAVLLHLGDCIEQHPTTISTEVPPNCETPTLLETRIGTSATKARKRPPGRVTRAST